MHLLLKNAHDAKPTRFFLLDTVANPIGEFSNNPKKGIMFTAYFQRYEDVFRKVCMG